MNRLRHTAAGHSRRVAAPLLWILPVLITALLLACSSPSGADPDIIDLDPDPDTIVFPREAVKVQSSIRFEAVIDTNLFPYKQFAGLRLKIALVCLPPADDDTARIVNLATYSANYLDLPAVGLPLNMSIPEEQFQYYSVVRAAAAVVLLFRDANENHRYDIGESVFGAGENSIYAYIEGKTGRLPFISSGTPRTGSNLLVRVGTGEEVRFHPSPDYSATIFIINVRGDQARYTLPYPWPVASPVQM